MTRKIFLGSLLLIVLAGGPVIGAEPGGPKPAMPEELTDAWERFQRVLQDWGGRLRERISGRDSREDRPLITLMLNNKERLALSADQVRKLEQLRDNFQRQSIRNDADIRRQLGARKAGGPFTVTIASGVKGRARTHARPRRREN